MNKKQREVMYEIEAFNTNIRGEIVEGKHLVIASFLAIKADEVGLSYNDFKKSTIERKY